MTTQNIFETQKLSYGECEQYTGLVDGDVVFCPSVYDGDTARLTWIDRTGKKVRSLVRIMNIDTPEFRGSSENEKLLALRAKERLENAVSGKFITIRNPGTEKYNRILSDIEVGDIKSVSEYMLADPEICRPYSGGARLSWD